MFREMRRAGQILPPNESIEILKNATSGVLSVIGDDGYPYGVPLSHAYADGKLYFHCAVVGHKIDAINKNDKVSFTVIQQDEVVKKRFTTYFRSVIAFGKAKVITDDSEKLRLINLLSERFVPGDIENRDKEVSSSWERFAIIQMDIEHVTGKEARELMLARNNG